MVVTSSTSRGAASSLSSIQVISYNVLSSHLATPWHYPRLNPEHLKAENRFPVILEKLEQEMNHHSSNPLLIICLQEVSYAWAGELHTFFANRNFHFVTGLYGKSFNGYMGVAMAWPHQVFDVLKVDICRLADTRTEGWPEEEEQQKPGIFNRWIRSVQSFLYDSTLPFLKLLTTNNNKNTDSPPPDHWSLSRSRSNVMLTACFKEKKDQSSLQFCIGNYHMPCAFYCPMAMTIHADLAAQHVHQVAQGLPYVLTGDFNIKPTDDVYQYLTTGNIQENSLAYPSPKGNGLWKPNSSLSNRPPLKSAYRELLGTEPDFTNFAQSNDQEEAFVETLDYIFLSPEWTVQSVRPTPRRESAQGPFPNLNVPEPSDHIMIGANIGLN